MLKGLAGVEREWGLGGSWILMRQATERQYAYNHKMLIYTQTREHTPKVHTRWEVRRWRRSTTDSLFSSKPDDWQLISRIQTRTMRRSHDTVDALRHIQNTAQPAVCSVWWVNTHLYPHKSLWSALMMRMLTDQHFSFWSDYGKQWTL